MLKLLWFMQIRCTTIVLLLHNYWAREAGIEFKNFSEPCDKKEAVNEVQQSLSKEAKSSKLDKSELPAKIKLMPEPWTPESGLVTAALKLKREQVNELQK